MGSTVCGVKRCFTYESRGNVVRELFGDDGEGGSEEGRVAQRLYYAYHKGQDYERIVPGHVVQQPKEDR